MPRHFNNFLSEERKKEREIDKATPLTQKSVVQRQFGLLVKKW